MLHSMMDPLNTKAPTFCALRKIAIQVEILLQQLRKTYVGNALIVHYKGALNLILFTYLFIYFL